MPPPLEWPPKKDDLERLYLEQRQSAAKIAKLYGLSHPNPKSSETLVLYHLRKFGIARRDPAEHVRKVTEEMVQEWIERYQKGASLKDIAGGEVDPVTVWNHLRRRGLQLRDKVDAQIQAVSKYPRAPFEGDGRDAAYLMGFVRGDLNVSRHGRAIRLKTATTHPLMVELLRSLFKERGYVRVHPRLSGLAGYEWSVQVDLHPTYSFVEPREKVPAALLHKELLWCFIGGFFDAEGSIWLEEGQSRFAVSITNTDVELLEAIREALHAENFEPHLRKVRNTAVWKLDLWGGEVVRFITMLRLRHGEKVRKRELVQKLAKAETTQQRVAVLEEWDALRLEIRRGRDEFVDEARRLVEGRNTT